MIKQKNYTYNEEGETMGKKDFNNWSSKELIDYIYLLEETIKKENKQFIGDFKWAGNLGQWFWYYEENRVIFNDLKATNIGYDPKQLGEIGYEFYTEKLHPDDYERVMENMRNHLKGITPAYEVEYRIQHKEGYYVWYYDRGVVTKRDENGSPLLLEGIVFDISEAKAVESKLAFLAENDELTKTYNRHMLFRYLEDSIDAYRSDKTPFALLMIDIDNFKQINDLYGHLMGDESLVLFANLIKSLIRTEDQIFRYGGDEFFILLPNTHLEGATHLGKRLLQSIQSEKTKKTLNLTLSMGVVEYQAYETIDNVLKRVDRLLYQAKQNGKNQISF